MLVPFLKCKGRAPVGDLFTFYVCVFVCLCMYFSVSVFLFVCVIVSAFVFLSVSMWLNVSIFFMCLCVFSVYVSSMFVFV